MKNDFTYFTKKKGTYELLIVIFGAIGGISLLSF